VADLAEEFFLEGFVSFLSAVLHCVVVVDEDVGEVGGRKGGKV
jgi:hypothetical protein